VVIVGAGPGGLEAARVSAERGHEVTLFEATDRPGGQINLAIRAPWREALSGITRWLDQQVRRLGVDLRCAQTATAAMVMALKPDLVVVATGGYPNKGNFQGAELAASSWDVLEGKVAPAKRVLFFDDNGQQQGPSVVEYMAQRGALVELVTPDREAAAEVGVTNMPVHMRSFYKHGVIITPDRRLTQVYAEGDHLIAVLSSEFGAADEEREIDQVICEHGTLPNEDLYWALRADSLNHGECDLTVLAEEDRVVDVVNNEGGKYRLYRIGDAVASRNIHAAIYDALRLCHTL
jgi:NADPH-dependent 2,4-dienoyl-CoA reductase/sulfur reductase-like enzyme